jgi:hypothetical protein
LSSRPAWERIAVLINSSLQNMDQCPRSTRTEPSIPGRKCRAQPQQVSCSRCWPGCRTVWPGSTVKQLLGLGGSLWQSPGFDSQHQKNKTKQNKTKIQLPNDAAITLMKTQKSHNQPREYCAMILQGVATGSPGKYRDSLHHKYSTPACVHCYP